VDGVPALHLTGGNTALAKSRFAKNTIASHRNLPPVTN